MAFYTTPTFFFLDINPLFKMANKKTDKKTTSAAPTKAAEVMPLKWWNNRKIIPVIFIALSFILYGNSLVNGFIKNDTTLITKNNFTKKGFNGITEILTNSTLKGRYGEVAENLETFRGTYRPLSLVFSAVLYEFFYGQPMPFHIWAVVLYGICIAVIYLTLRKIFEKLIGHKNAAIYSLLASLLFLFHPVHTEVVNNVSNTDEILSLIFCMSSLFFGLKYLENKKTINIGASGLFIFFGLLSHENAAVFLFIVPFTLWLVQKNKKKNLKLLLSIGVLLLVFFGIYFFIKKSIVGDPTNSSVFNLLTNPFVKVEGTNWVHYSFGEKTAAIFYALGKYVQLLVFPHPLTSDYNPMYIPILSLGNIKVIGSLLLYFSTFIYVLYSMIKGKKNLIIYGLFFFLVSILFVSNIFFPLGINLSEVLLFQPSLGFCVMVAGLIYKLAKNKENIFKKIIAPVLALIFLLFAVKTIIRNPDFESNKILLNKDIQTSPNSATLHYFIAALKAEDALHTLSSTEKSALATEALGHLNKAIEINPNYIDGYYMMGNVYYMQGLYAKAVEAYEICLSINENYNKALPNLAIALKEAAKANINNKTNIDDAIRMLNKSYQIFNDKEVVDLLEQARFLYDAENNNN